MPTLRLDYVVVKTFKHKKQISLYKMIKNVKICDIFDDSNASKVSSNDLSELNYRMLLSIDTKIESEITNLPVFFILGV